MKAIIVTAALASVFSFGNIIQISAQDNSHTYSNVEVNPEDNTTTTTFYQGGKNINTTPEKQQVVKHDENNNPIEKTIYNWSEVSNKWIPSQKQEFSYNTEGQMISSTFTKWDTKKKSWEKNSKHLVYSYDNSGQMVMTAEK